MYKLLSQVVHALDGLTLFIDNKVTPKINKTANIAHVKAMESRASHQHKVVAKAVDNFEAKRIAKNAADREYQEAMSRLDAAEDDLVEYEAAAHQARKEYV